jgi:transcription termination/antitermination protein NusG
LTSLETCTDSWRTDAPLLGREDGFWVALWTHSHCETLVCDQLVAKGFHAFLPTISTWSRQGGARRLIRVPLFPGYLFVHHALDKRSYVEILKTRGLARVLGERWDRPAVVDESEIDAIRRALGSQLPVLMHPYLRDGQRVRITDGPLTDVEGILVESKPNKGLLVLSVKLLQRSVAIEIDCTAVVPC